MHRCLAALALSSLAAAAGAGEPPDALKPLAFLAGHCWKGTFPDGRYTSDGETMTYRARWTRQGDQAYETLSEAQTPKGWATMFKLVMKRTD